MKMCRGKLKLECDGVGWPKAFVAVIGSGAKCFFTKSSPAVYNKHLRI